MQPASFYVASDRVSKALRNASNNFTGNQTIAGNFGVTGSVAMGSSSSAAGFAAVALAITMAVICFVMGKGRIFTDDQHPFLFILLAAVFFFLGAGKWSLDHRLHGNKSRMPRN